MAIFKVEAFKNGRLMFFPRKLTRTNEEINK
jgi:hypothetical protein